MASPPVSRVTTRLLNGECHFHVGVILRHDPVLDASCHVLNFDASDPIDRLGRLADTALYGVLETGGRDPDYFDYFHDTLVDEVTHVCPFRWPYVNNTAVRFADGGSNTYVRATVA